MVLSTVLLVLAAGCLAVALRTGDPDPVPGWTAYTAPSEDSGWTAYAPLDQDAGLGPWHGAAAALLFAAAAVAATARPARRR
jgi:hypothetical protein